jgi:hypothetical protein
MTLAFAVEPFGAALPEIERIMYEHWQEVRSAGGPALALDYPVYAGLEAAGALLLVAARDEACGLAGYILHIVHRPMHYRDTLMAADDAHFLRPAFRRGSAFLRMARFAEDRLRERGVQMVRYHTKARPDLDKSRVFERLGYHCQEKIMLKQIGG